MPELPEVETTCRGIGRVLTGRIASGCIVRNAAMRLPVPPDLSGRVAGRRLEAVERRAKYLLLRFGDGIVIVHLGMSGSLRVVPADAPPGPHDHVDIVFGAEALRLRDPRRFGLVVWHEGEPATHPLLASLGVEPLGADFDGEWLFAATRGASTPIKLFLMNAHRVVGVGNIYASESLFRARIHPLTPAGQLGRPRCARLATTVRETLVAAIAAGGSTLRDFVGGDGRAGYFQQQYFVYGRDGESCRVCGATIRRALVGQRSTFWCPRCQRR
ncbi:bifunctional DNA-formamidopyrimidine glycosylase/DNA-(apurinic or apyrimidinic site) lyase [Pseudazoarcus pumilus]|uniref:Formamidopyrimidine-DNA glycosylase n=1 Tax=Pseudazoarcus pumilus TaxID=2067960 RepID=A0A2I6S4Y0_9RHOO|nr:bifunctional DNA-formamidopyrimidine glycosylase/DNA-(apurinic or apyrimidinic site) lyase [Pseudazoarcus pumilus]AUN94318.1 DNA-formamidopyrimidine glycosylase [Pseudazoarcus pumilus]